MTDTNKDTSLLLRQGINYGHKKLNITVTLSLYNKLYKAKLLSIQLQGVRSRVRIQQAENGGKAWPKKLERFAISDGLPDSYITGNSSTNFLYECNVCF